MDLGLKGKKIFITGASRGIGLASVRSFLEEGARVLLSARKEDAPEEVFKKLRKEYGEDNIFLYIGDLTQESEMQKFVEDGIKSLGGVDILVTNIGSGKPEGDPSSKEEWDRVSKINFLSATGIIEIVLETMRKQKSGSIVMMSSIAGLEDIGAPAPYAAAKKSILHLMKETSRKIARDNIRINAVAPGNIKFEGGRWEEILKENSSVLDKIKKNVPMERLGKPEEIGDIVCFLASDRASFVTGSCWVADGGETKNI